MTRQRHNSEDLGYLEPDRANLELHVDPDPDPATAALAHQTGGADSGRGAFLGRGADSDRGALRDRGASVGQAWAEGFAQALIAARAEFEQAIADLRAYLARERRKAILLGVIRRSLPWRTKARIRSRRIYASIRYLARGY